MTGRQMGLPPNDDAPTQADDADVKGTAGS